MLSRTLTPTLFVALLSLGCSRSPSNSDPAAKSTHDSGGPAAEGAKALNFNRDATAFEAALTAIDHEIAATAERVAKQPNSWLVRDKLASLYMRRARLSGSYADYANAQATLDEAFEIAPEGSGPMLTRVALNFTLHRLAPLELIEADLAAVEARPVVDDPTRAHIASVRGDVAFERGQYAEARTFYDAALELSPKNSTLIAKLAQWHWRAGEFDKADELYRQAEQLMLPAALEGRAWVQLQLGIMDLERGRYDDAFEHFRDGADILGGWWLLEEHIAEIATLKKLDAFALELYTEIIARTGKGEFMDAKASILLAAGDQAGATKQIELAVAVYEAQLEQFPEASYGHALGHYLDFGPAARALELAEANHGLRPGVPAKVSLAEARLGVGDVAGAQQIIDEALATTWVSADLFWVASLVYTQVGDEARAKQLREQAVALHPTIAADY
ncbi:tetratricopeptide repeat protein [Enhygromyxa salina]|uniref:Photosystem I assembly protein Ycf3 n=1 Tax=Enhygromyxa salina TaxID=215803 RepID=A0A2S9YY63_9BACT|nr:tetratricopeptide repeat protein [Enhygromyxa salina]PRQ10026.1 photosystem I assembly protein Ycf3 [Enhygromyxa salina]